MFNIGGPEVLVIALIALVVVGPEQLPSVLRKAGKQVAQLRAMTASVRDEFMAGVDAVDPTTWEAEPKPTSAAPMASQPVAEPEATPSPPLEDEGPSPEVIAAQLDAAEQAAERNALGEAAADAQAAKFEARKAADTKLPTQANAEVADTDVSEGATAGSETPDDAS